MVPLNLLSRLVPRTLTGRTLRTSVEGRLKQCGGSGGGSSRHRDADAPCHSDKKVKPRRCIKKEAEAEGEVRGETADPCSKEAMQDCVRKLEDLQKQWEAAVRAAERMEAGGGTGGGKRASGCPVKPPRQPDKEGASPAVKLAVLAVLAGVAYFLYTLATGGEDEAEDDKEEKKDDKEKKNEDKEKK